MVFNKNEISIRLQEAEIYFSGQVFLYLFFSIGVMYRVAHLSLNKRKNLLPANYCREIDEILHADLPIYT